MNTYMTQQILGYHLYLYRKSIERRKPSVINDFFKRFLTRFELINIINWKMKDLGLTPLALAEFSEEELWELIEDDHTILCYYLAQWEESLQGVLNASRVWKTLEQLQLHTHYLASKPIADWDKYDHSNYRSLQIKAGNIIRVYGIYDCTISQQEIAEVTQPPLRYFESYEDADKALHELITDGNHAEEELHILYKYQPI